MPNDLTFVAVETDEQVEWLRVQRNRPELYKYFRQDKPITQEEQRRWWKSLRKNAVKLFILEANGERIGYAGFNPFMILARKAEFGIFIVPERQNLGYGKKAMLQLLEYGFGCGLSLIYSDVIMYPGEEDKWLFYKSLGFEPYDHACQNVRYKKKGQMVPSLRFYMTKDMWKEVCDKNGSRGMEARQERTAVPETRQVRPRRRGRPSKRRVPAAAG